MPFEHFGVWKDQQGSSTIGRELHRLRWGGEGNVEQEGSNEEPAWSGHFKAPKNLRANCALKMIIKWFHYTVLYS